jgi:hypothetical protein
MAEWIPAFAGMTVWIPAFAGMTVWIPAFAGMTAWIPAFAGMAEWIPAFAGMTVWIPALAGMTVWISAFVGMTVWILAAVYPHAGGGAYDRVDSRGSLASRSWGRACPDCVFFREAQWVNTTNWFLKGFAQRFPEATWLNDWSRAAET